jgi:SAM-dependent methyltransferase
MRLVGIGTEREERIRWRHALPRGRPVDRHEAILDAARGKRVAHRGVVDELMASKIASGVWLHAGLADSARELVGLDSDEAGVAAAEAEGYEAHVVDLQSEDAVTALGLEPFDVIVAGEIIEHLDAPGPFLRALLRLAADDTVLVVTTPNAYRLLNSIVPLSRTELIHPDHTAWHTPQTLRTLLERSGWRVEEIRWYRNPRRREIDPGLPAARRARAHAANAARVALTAAHTLVPSWSDGMFVTARPAGRG